MMTQTLRRFWKALEQIPGGETDAREWRLRLGDEQRAVSRYLRPTGEYIGAVGCPSPGGDACPRKVICLGHGRYRAVCQTRPPLCESLDLCDADVAVLAVDRPRLFQDLAAALDSSPSTPVRGTNDPVVEIGRHAIAAGISAPLFLAMPDPRRTLEEATFRAAGLSSDPATILLLTENALSADSRGRLQDAGHEILILPDVIGGLRTEGLVSLQPAAVLLQRVRGALRARLTTDKTGPAWPLPPGTRWEQITLRLIADETMLCSINGVSRDLDPQFFGMRSKKNNKPTKSWGLLCLLASYRGRRHARDRTRIAVIHKRCSLLRRELCGAFGLEGDPLPWLEAEQAYVAKFVISDERPRRRGGLGSSR